MALHYLIFDGVLERYPDLKIVSVHLSRELEVLKIENRLQSRAEREMERGQREYFLRQQLRAIQQELGSGDEEEEEVRQLAAWAASRTATAAVCTYKDLVKIRQHWPGEMPLLALTSRLEVTAGQADLEAALAATLQADAAR